MAVKFNPFTGQLQIDEKGSGGGSSYLDGEVQNFSALPETIGSPAVDSAYLVREAEGAWLLGRKPAGIYIRTANTGTRASDWTYAGEFPDVFNDANLVIYNGTDSTKNVKFDASAIATGTTRTITVPNANVTLPNQGTSTTDTPTFAGATINQSGTWGLTVNSGATQTNTAEFTGDSTDYNLIRVLNTDVGSSFYMACTGSGYSGSNFGESNAGQASLEVNGGGTNPVGLIGNRNGPLCLGADDQIQFRLDSNGTTISDPTDITKKVRLSAASVTAGQTRVVTFPDKNITLDDAGDARTPTAHNHNASDINAGTLTHERGGLEADVSAYSGLVKISGGATSAVTVTTAGEALLDDVDAAAQRTTLGLGTAATSASTDFVAVSTIDAKGDLLVGTAADTVARLAVGATNGHVLTVDSAEASGMKWAAASGGIGGSTGATDNSVLRSDGTGGSTSQGSSLVVDDAVVTFTGITGDAGTDIITATGSAFSNGQRVRFTSLTGGSGLNTTTNYFVINASGATFQLSTSEGGAASLFTTNITAGTLLTGHAVQAHVAIRNNSSDTNSPIVLCNKGTGAFIVSPSVPDGTATGGGNARAAESVCIVPERSAATQVASGARSVNIGRRSTASAADSVAIGSTATGSGTNAVAIGLTSQATQLNTIAIGNNCQSLAEAGVTLGNDVRVVSGAFYGLSIGQEGRSNNQECIAIGGYQAIATGNQSIVLGSRASTNGTNAIAIGYQGSSTAVSAAAIGNGVTSDLRSGFFTRPFRSVYWGGTTTNNTATILNLDGTATATDRFTIAANTALAVDILLVARRSDVADKWLVARRFLGIRRDGSNNTSLIGAVQALGTDQSAGTPTWSFTLTADDTNDALQLEVTGATSETVVWRATAIYRVA